MKVESSCQSGRVTMLARAIGKLQKKAHSGNESPQAANLGARSEDCPASALRGAALCPGNDGDGDFAHSAAAENAGGFIRRGPRGHYIVHEQHPRIAKAPTRTYAKSAADVCRPIFVRQLVLRTCEPRANERA